MALREGTRRWAMRGAWAALLVATSLLIGLRVGRPICYTDGARSLDGRALAGAGMLQWRTPEVAVEVPGPVAGRIALLPDGRLLYGRLGPDGTSDLVTWDPRRASVPPEPVYGLNTPQNELAPAVGADGRIWFASDRDGGAGGYDIYTAPGLAAAPGEVAPVPACRTALDETDPAPHPNGVDLVFVRSDRRIDGGNDGTLWRWRFGDPLDPVPVFAPPPRHAKHAIARDPVFAADGAALWFVTKEPGAPLALVRASLQNGAYDDPVRVGGEWPTGELRSPAPSADGHALALLRASTPQHAADLWYVARAHEVYPWWPGQRWLEWLLGGVIGTSTLLLVLLHLGRRWSTLDLLAQCLLLSLLLHVLLFLWLMGVEVIGALATNGDDAGGFEVSVVAAGVPATATASGGAGGGSEIDEAVRFTPNERSLAADAPGTSPVRAETAPALAPGAGEWEHASEARTVAATVALADAAAAAAQRNGADDATPVAPAALAALDTAAGAHAATTHAVRSAGATAAVAVVVPSSGVARAPSLGEALAPPAAAPLAALAIPGPAAHTAVAAPALHEAPPPTAGRGAAPNEERAAGSSDAAGAAAGAAALQPVAFGEGAPASGSPAVAAHRAHGESAPAEVAAVPHPGSALARPKAALGGAAAMSVQGAALAAPVAHGVPAPAAASMHDAPSAAVVPNATSRANRTPDAGGASSAGNTGSTAGSDGAGSARAAIAAVGTPTPAPTASTAARPQRASDPGAAGERAFAVAPPRTQLARGARSATAAGAPTAAPLAHASAYSNRFGPAKAKALEQFGGTADTERAVANGLRYLAKIQNDDGSWGDRSDFDGKYGFVYVGKTALCVLAFLGAGHTPQSRTEHSEVVQKALAHLLSLQDETGAFGPSSCYGHGIATYALAECYGITKNAELVRPLERALTWILDNQGPRRDRRNRGGWGYFSPGLKAEDDYARVSVSAWMVMALESARLSGVELPTDVLPAAREFLEQAFDQPNGWFRYNHKPSRVNSAWPTLPASTPAGAFCLLLLGAGKDNAMVRAAVDFTVERRPEQYRRYADEDFVLRGQGNVYFWYYGTLACFLAGGDAWDRWNERLRTVLPQAQGNDGSWTPIDVYAQEAGDNRRDHGYTTAMCVLCLEVYYRYFTPLLLGR
jgi:hypothetical protein